VHHGRVVNRTGDGILIEFRSVVDAVRCAIEVQNGMIERNAGLPPEAPPSSSPFASLRSSVSKPSVNRHSKLVGCSTRQVFPDIYLGRSRRASYFFAS
jgi:hypothetical protein